MSLYGCVGLLLRRVCVWVLNLQEGLDLAESVRQFPSLCKLDRNRERHAAAFRATVKQVEM